MDKLGLVLSNALSISPKDQPIADQPDREQSEPQALTDERLTCAGGRQKHCPERSERKNPPGFGCIIGSSHEIFRCLLVLGGPDRAKQATDQPCATDDRHLPRKARSIPRSPKH